MSNREFKRWLDMMESCYNPSDPAWQFNGRHSVIVDPSWHTFDNFLKDVGPMPGYNSVLDRHPGTDCFSINTTYWRQGRERALLFLCVYQSVSAWSNSLNIPKGTITSRISKNLPIEMVLSKSRLATKNLDGVRFGMLTVVSHRFNRRSLDFWKCKCDCGKQVTLAAKMLQTNRVRSCGCVPSLQVKLCTLQTKLSYLNKTRKITEWAGIVGIQASLIAKRVRAGWSAEEALGYTKRAVIKGTRRLSYLTGIAESTLRHRKTIGATARDLASSSRMSTGKLWDCDGMSMTLGQWAVWAGIEESTLRTRLYHNWSIKEAITIPTKRFKNEL